MAEVKWIKIVTDIFDDSKILLIEKLPDAYAIIVAWFKLLCLAGKENNGGVFRLNEQIYYTDEMLASIFRMPVATVRLALTTFEKFGMIEIIDGIITIPNWEKHQSESKLESIRQYNRIAKQKERERKRQLLLDSHGHVNESHDTDIDKDIDKEYIDSSYKESCPSICPDEAPEPKKTKKRRTYEPDSVPYRLAVKLEEMIHANNPEAKVQSEPGLQSWADTFRRMMEIDKRTPRAIYDVMFYAQNDDFWKSNILSAATLRKQYDRLRMKMEGER